MECDGCTLCCMVLPVPWMNKEAGDWCVNCDVGVGCSIFGDSITDECRKFQCAYNQIDNAPIELRPDKCKVIFEKVDDSLFLGTMHPEYNEAYKDKIIQRELMTFFDRGFSVVINSFTIEHPVIYPAKNKTMAEVWSSLQKQSKEHCDSAIIHN